MKVLVLFLGVLAVATVGGVVLGDGNIALALTPAVLLTTVYACCTLPLRHSVSALTFLALTLENPSDIPAEGLYRTPLYKVGALLLAHLNVTLPYKALLFSGLDVVLVLLFGVAFYRWAMRSRIDLEGRVPGPSPLIPLAAMTVGAAAWLWVWGMTRGGADVASSLWQVQRVVYLPVVFLLFQLAFRGPDDFKALGKVLLLAACCKAVLAMYIRATVPPGPDEPTLSYATTHADSMLFATALALVVVYVFESRGKKRAFVGLVVGPLLVAGMIANNRRVVWVEVAAALVTTYAMLPTNPIKRRVSRVLVIVSPLLVAYCLAGWGSQASIFKPIQIARSVIDSDADASTNWRDWENYDLSYTLREGPILGVGYGHGFDELVKLPDISRAYALYRFIPHNSILGLWAYGGLVGFTALWLLLPAGVFLAARAHRFATRSLERVLALSAVGAIVVYLIHCYGDMGLGTWTAVFTVAPALAAASKLAVATGAWPIKLGKEIP